MKATRAFSGVMPRMGLVALRHHSSCARNTCCQKVNGKLSQAPSSKRRSPLAGANGFSSAISLVAEFSRKRASRADRVQGENPKLHLSTRCAGNMRGQPGGELEAKRPE